MKIPSSLAPFAQGLDMDNAAGRLQFFARWFGGNDPRHLYTVEIDPEIAGWILLVTTPIAAKNRQRRLSSRRIGEYVDEMLKERWYQNAGWPLVYSQDGRFGNGYGRMAAVLRSGLKQSFLVVGPWTRSQILAIDRGHQRTPPDNLSIKYGIAPEIRPKLFCDMTAVIRHYLRGAPVPFSECAAERECLTDRFLGDYTILYDIVKTSQPLASFRVPPVMAAFCYAHHQHPQEIPALWEKLAYNDGLRLGDPLHTMYHEIVFNRTKTARNQLLQMTRLLHGISAALHGRPLKSLQTKGTTEFSDPAWNAIYRASTPDML